MLFSSTEQSSGRTIALHPGVGVCVSVSKMLKFLHYSFLCDGQGADR